MALLEYDELGLEFRVVRAHTQGDGHRTARYEIRFLWNGENIINERILKRREPYWQSETLGAFIVDDYDPDWLFDMLEKALAEGEEQQHRTVDPDLLLAIREVVPVEPLWEKEELRREREERERLKAEVGRLPDDLFDVIAKIDAYQFRNADAYFGDGLALYLTVERHQLESFRMELRREYEIALAAGHS